MENQGQRAESQGGFGMIEIIISMFLIGLLAVAFLPFLVKTLQVSSVNTSVAVATQLANAQMEKVRAKAPTCDAVRNTEVVLPVSDNQGSTLVSSLIFEEKNASGAWAALGACPTSYPTLLRVTARATPSSDPSKVRSQIITLVYVKAAI
jgi:type II secretory pathway pseudopilin PulG